MMKNLLCLALLAVSLTACKSQQAAVDDAGRMSYFSYREITSGTYNPSFEVVKEGKDVTVYINRHSRKEKVMKGDAELLRQLQAIVDKYHIQDYQKKYAPNRDIMDGMAWVLKINYTQPPFEITSTGANSWPDNGISAFSEIKSLFIEYFHLDERRDF